jgi:hypothetical protein
MTKQEIDMFITKHYVSLKEIGDNIARKNMREYDGSLLLSESYIQALKIKESIKADNNLKAVMISNMNLQGKQEFSRVNYELRLRHETIDKTHLKHSEQNDYSFDNELKLNNYKARLYQYRQNCDSVNGIIFDAYFHKHQNTVRKFAKYFELSNATAQKLITKLKTQIINYENTKKRISGL